MIGKLPPTQFFESERNLKIRQRRASVILRRRPSSTSKRNSFPVTNLANPPDHNGPSVTGRYQYGITGLNQFRKQFL